eukprot:UN34123
MGNAAIMGCQCNDDTGPGHSVKNSESPQAESSDRIVRNFIIDRVNNHENERDSHTRIENNYSIMKIETDNDTTDGELTIEETESGHFSTPQRRRYPSDMYKPNPDDVTMTMNRLQEIMTRHGLEEQDLSDTRLEQESSGTDTDSEAEISQNTIILFKNY